jgi:hypothetical protein
LRAAVLCAVFLTLLTGCPGPTTPPDDKRVGEALTELKREQRDALRENARRDFVISQMAGWLKDNVFYLRILIISGVGAVVVLLIVLLIRFLTARQYRLKRAPLMETPGEGTGLAAPDPARLAELAAGGEYSQAIVLLHRLSVAHLVARQVLPAKNLTNAGILSRLPDNAVRKVFRLIAEASERILFDRESATQDEYARCREEYRRTFRDGRT